MDEKELKEIKEELKILRAVFASLAEGVLIIDRDMHILMANKEYFTQEHQNNVIGRHCYEVSHRLSKPCYENGEDCPVKKTFEIGELSRAVHTHIDRDGNKIYVSLKAFPVKDASGEVIYVIETINDITGRKKANDELRKKVKELEEFYNMAVGRELRMVELKAEIEKLKEELKAYKEMNR